MTSPPAYSSFDTLKIDPVPPYKASHRFANSEEELAALKEFALSKLYINPGTDGTLPDIAAGLNWSGTNDQKSIARVTPEMKADRRRQKEEKVARKAAGQERRPSIGQVLKRVVSGGGSSQRDSKTIR